MTAARAGLSLEFGFENERAGAITATYGAQALRRGNEPAAIIGGPEQRGKARGRIEAGPAQPIDRAVAADQSRRLAVADQRIVFDSQCHRMRKLALFPSVGCQIKPEDDLRHL